MRTFRQEIVNTLFICKKFINTRRKGGKIIKSERNMDLVSDTESVAEVTQEVTQEAPKEIEVIDLTDSVRPTPIQSPVRIMNNGIILEGEMNPRQETDGCTSPLRIYQNGLTLEEISQAPSPDQSDQPPRPIGSMGRALQRI